jgi:hypothetical protein
MMLLLQGIERYKYHAVEAPLLLSNIKQIINNSAIYSNQQTIPQQIVRINKHV